MSDIKTNIGPNPEVNRYGADRLGERLTGFQSYDHLNPAGGLEAAIKLRETGSLDLTCPGLDDVSELEALARFGQGESMKGSVSTAFRTAEVYYTLSAARLNSTLNPDQRSVDRFMEVGAELYGKPNTDVIGWCRSWAYGGLEMIQGASQEISDLISKISDGYTITRDGSEVIVPSIGEVFGPNSADYDNGFKISDEAKEKLLSFFENRIGPAYRSMEDAVNSGKLKFPLEAQGIKEAFEMGIDGLGMAEAIGAELEEGSTVLSWSSVDAKVKIGSDRVSIKNIDELKAVFAHEVGVHGIRYVKGLELEDPNLVSGTFYEPVEGYDGPASYLDFEEGLASLVQKLISNKPLMSIQNAGYHLIAHMAEQGYEPAVIQAFCTNLRVLGSAATVLKRRGEVNKERIDRLYGTQGLASAKQVIRMFRGTPTDEPLRTTSGAVIYYPKDLAYANGIIGVIRYLEGGPKMDKLLDCGKIDPRNPIYESVGQL
ncbi:MAG TPA: hypothetical protein PKA29_02975 [Candidatus Saccharibacteria bacterium]|nr:hypothetical protein [Candidatus Saccharibacteria bacterium]